MNAKPTRNAMVFMPLMPLCALPSLLTHGKPRTLISAFSKTMLRSGQSIGGLRNATPPFAKVEVKHARSLPIVANQPLLRPDWIDHLVCICLQKIVESSCLGRQNRNVLKFVLLQKIRLTLLKCLFWSSIMMSSAHFLPQSCPCLTIESWAASHPVCSTTTFDIVVRQWLATNFVPSNQYVRDRNPACPW
jgi:hypothetical protein